MKFKCENRANWSTFLLLVFALPTLLAARNPCAAQTDSSTGSHRIYDNFNEKWIDPARWLTGAPGCWGLSPECVREIRHGQLYLATRNIGWNGGNADTQWSQSDLFFPAPNTIVTITADVTVLGASGTNCSLNPELSGAQVRIGGTFLNSGTGSPGDDLWAYVIANHPDQVVDYGIWWGWQSQSQWVHLTNIPMGTPVTTTIRWDQTNHQFIAILKAPDGISLVGISSYAIADSTPAANPSKSLSAATYAPNFTVRTTTSNVEANFDNVIVNQ
jgi:hypothetical protein